METLNREQAHERTIVSGKSNIAALVTPRSVAIIGMSSKPESAGQVVLHNLVNGGYTGEIHLVGRSGGVIDQRPVLTDVKELPIGIDLAILMLPADAVLETVKACISRQVKSAVCFASGFAEMGEEGRAQQKEIGEIATAGNLTLLGPNTVGYFNYVDAFYVMMVKLVLPPPMDRKLGPAVAVAAQSGGLGAHIAASLQARGVPLSYMMTTGNEANTGLAEMLAFFAEDDNTGAVVVYAEQIRSATDFSRAVRLARERGKYVVVLHPGRSERSKQATQSHTGALAGNHGAMRLMLEHAGAMVVDTLEEAIDLGQLLLRFRTLPVGGLGLVTGSGAICGITQDYVEPLGLELPPLADAQVKALAEHLPAYTPPRNPLDLGTLFGWQPELITRGVAAMADDDKIGSIIVSLPMGEPEPSLTWLRSFLAGRNKSEKPAIFVMQNEDVPFSDAFKEEVKRSGAIVMRSPERALRALARLTQFGRDQAAAASGPAAQAWTDITSVELGSGVQSEWIGKRLLKVLGVPTPPGALAKTPEDAIRIATEIGYPVALKAQAAKLAHKSDAGGVLLAIQDDAQLRAKWLELHENIRRAAPGITLDGVLVEAMGARGLELVVGASRDPHWGPILMVGLGGVWVEALGDVQLLPADLPKPAIIERLRRLKAAKLLTGFRGAPPVDLDAVADVVTRVGQLMLQHPQIDEIDINPLVAYPEGQGVLALDALVVTRQ